MSRASGGQAAIAQLARDLSGMHGIMGNQVDDQVADRDLPLLFVTAGALPIGRSQGGQLRQMLAAYVEKGRQGLAQISLGILPVDRPLLLIVTRQEWIILVAHRPG